jgi:heat shock protein HslJ
MEVSPVVGFFIVVSALLFGGVLSCDAQRDVTSQVAGESNGATSDVTPLEGTLWKFVEVEGEPIVPFDNEEAPQIRLIAEEHTLTASLSCNLFKGTYETEGNGLRLQLTPVSWRECQASHEQEELLRRVIGAVTTYRVDDDRLSLVAESQVVAVLVPVK